MMAVEHNTAPVEEDSGITVDSHSVEDKDVENKSADDSSPLKEKSKMKRLFSVKSINKLSFKNGTHDTPTYKELAEERAVEIKALESKIVDLSKTIEQITKTADDAQKTEASLEAELERQRTVEADLKANIEAAKIRETELVAQLKIHTDRVEAERLETVRLAEEALKAANQAHEDASEKSLKEKVSFFMKEMPAAR